MEDFLCTINTSYNITIDDQICYYNPATKEVHIKIKMTCENGLSSNGVWGYVPKKYRPSSNAFGYATANNNNAYIIGDARINANGQLMQYAATSAKVVFFMFDYHL